MGSLPTAYFWPPETDTSLRKRIRFIEGNAKSLRLKIDPKKDFPATVYFSEGPLPLLSFCLGVVNFVYSKSGPMLYSIG
jgi:hypothetical protein